MQAYGLRDAGTANFQAFVMRDSLSSGVCNAGQPSFRHMLVLTQ